MLATALFPADIFPESELLPALLDLSLTGIVAYTPITDASGAVVDLAFAYLNPAAQRIIGLPARPAVTYLARFPNSLANGAFAFHRDALHATATQQVDIQYQADGYDTYFRVAARRLGGGLLVSFADIGDYPRSAVEEALRASQAREQQARAEAERQQAILHHVLMQAPAMICIFEGPTHRFQLVNGPYQALVGERLLLGKPIAEAMPELAGQPIFDLLDKVYRTGEPFVATEMLVQLDHDNSRPTTLAERYYNFTYQARYDLHGQIDGILVFAYEVTAQVRARHLIEDSASQLAELNRQLDSSNEELAATNEELLAANEEFLTNNTELARTQQALRQLNLGLEARVAARSREVQAALHEAEQQREQLRTLFMDAPAPIAILDGPSYVYQFVNPAYQQIFPGRKLAGRPVFEALPELADTAVPGLLGHVYTTGEPFVAQELPLELARHDGGELQLLYFNFTYQPRYNARGQIDGILVFAYEVTEQVRARQTVEANRQQAQALADELAATNQRLRRTNADLDTFVYTASHDLKSPIANLEGLITALREQLPPDALQAPLVPRLLEMMDGAVLRFRETLTHLTDVSRLQPDTDGAPAELVDLSALVRAVRLDLTPDLEAAGATLSVDLADAPTVRFSPKNLRSIVYNLLSNAVKYHDPTRAPLVQLRARRTDSQLVLEVEDNGLGLDPSQQGKLFGMFRRLHTHVEGSGVGLYMVKRLVENAGGRIHVASQPGVGSIFSVSLPA